jgi:UDPglucose 6-dehydrogenase
LFGKHFNCFGGESEFKVQTLATWGLAFKVNTDNMCEAPGQMLIEALWRAGVGVRAFDPVAMPEPTHIHGSSSNLRLCAGQYATFHGVDELVIYTEWQHFRAPEFSEMAARMRSKTIVDGPNLYHLQKPQQEGWHSLSLRRSATASVSREEKVWHFSRSN